MCGRASRIFGKINFKTDQNLTEIPSKSLTDVKKFAFLVLCLAKKTETIQ